MSVADFFLYAGPLIGSIVTAAGALAVARLRRSGKIATTEAEQLWNEARKIREELRIEADGKTVAESYMLLDGKEIKMMEIVAVRKK